PPPPQIIILKKIRKQLPREKQKSIEKLTEFLSTIYSSFFRVLSLCYYRDGPAFCQVKIVAFLKKATVDGILAMILTRPEVPPHERILGYGPARESIQIFPLRLRPSRGLIFWEGK
ncbi:MAG: hypothetical protein LBB98_10385, partial [Treponema sp.]|nr:hypothetical protein [Treponema sp.]